MTLIINLKIIYWQKLNFSFPFEQLLWLSKESIDDFKHLIQLTKVYSDIIGVPDSRLIKDKLSSMEVSLLNYSYEFCSMGASGGGNLNFIRNHISYRNDEDL